jgi:hypothetical protein
MKSIAFLSLMAVLSAAERR